MTQLLKIVLLQLLLNTSIKAFDFAWLTDLKGENSGHTTCLFLTLPHSANALATGLASSGGANDATDVPFFTSNTAFADRYRFSLTHLEWFMGLRKEYLGAYFPITDIGTAGFYSQLFTPGSIGHARSIDEMPSDPRIYEYSIGASFARQLIYNTLSAGGTVSFLESHLDGSIARGVTGNIDMSYSPFSLLRAHLYFANIGKSVKFETISESLPAEAGLSIQFFPLSKKTIDKYNISWAVGIGARKIADQPVAGGINTELKIMNMLSIRSGYEHSYGKTFSAEGFGAGASFQLGKYGIDGGWRYQSEDLGFIWSATLRLQLEELIPKNAEQYYNIAVKHYNKNRLALCEYYAKKALSTDPNMWKAHTLISKLRSDIMRKNNLEIGLIYTGNINGNFAQPYDPSALGGLARLTAILKTLQSQFQTALTIDAGNIIAPGSDKLHMSVAGRFIDRVDFDIIAGGENEVNSDLYKVHKSLGLEKPKRFLMNNASHSQSIIAREEIVEKQGYRISIISLVNEHLIDTMYRSDMRPLPESGIISGDAAKCDLHIAIIHDSWQNIGRNRALFKGIDILIAGSLDQHFQSPMKLDSMLVLSAGADGNYAGNLILRFDSDKRLISAENRLIAVSDEIKPDSVIADAVSRLTRTFPESEKLNAAPKGLSISSPDGVFAFISDRNGSDQIFLKITSQNAEYPISGSDENAYKPLISFYSSKMAFIGKNDTSRYYSIVNLPDFSRRLCADSLQINNIDITPDGKWLFYSAGVRNKKQFDIMRQRFDGGPSFTVVQTDSANESEMTFSPKDNLMVYGSYTSGFYQLYMSDQNGQKPVVITQERSDNFSPIFSPDGKKIAYLSDRSNFGGKLDIWVYDCDMGATNQITRHSNVKEFCWLPDSRTVVFSSGVNIYSIYKTAIRESSYSTLIKRDTLAVLNERSPQYLKVKNEDKILFTREQEDGTRKIFWVNIDGSNEQCVVNSKGNDWLPNYRR